MAQSLSAKYKADVKRTPEDEDLPFVAGHEILEDEKSTHIFRFFISTKRLLKMATVADKMHAHIQAYLAGISSTCLCHN